MTLPLLEKHYQQRILDLARLQGWTLRYHTFDSRHSASGFPDLVLVRRPEIVFWEVKTDRGTVTVSQRTWLDALTACGLEACVVRPADWEYVQQRLSR